MVIGIGGVSNAGKTTLATRLAKQLEPLRVKVLCQDDFAKPLAEIPLIRSHMDWETPLSIDLVKYYKHILEANETYDVVIAEGLFAFCDQHLNKHYDKRIFLTISKRVFWERKSKDLRWGKEPEWYMEHIWQSHFKCGVLKEVNPKTLVLSGEHMVDLEQLMPFLEMEKYLTTTPTS